MTNEPESNPLLAPFFNGEGGYCQLLHMLLTADTVLARTFRKSFSQKVLEPKLQVRIGETPLYVRSEVTVHPPGGVSQTIDLVIYLDNDVVGIEAKVFASSARKGQLYAQYKGLRHENPNKHVHVLFIFPMPTVRDKEVKQTNHGDRAGSVTWDDIFSCLPLTGETDPDILLGAIIKQALAQFAVIRKRLPKTVLTPERDAVKEEMEKVVELFNNALRDTGGDLSGCIWKPHFWRDPRVDSYYGSLTDSNGKLRKGQNLVLEAHYKEDVSSVPEEGIRMSVAFRLERRGGVKMYQAEFQTKRQACMNQLPSPQCGEDGNRVFTDVWIRVCGEKMSGVDGRPVRTVLADLLFKYSSVFSDFLLRNAHPSRTMFRSPNAY